MSPADQARHHIRFWVALLAGLASYFASRGYDPQLARFLAGDVFFATYLLLMGWFVASSTVERLRRRADVEDEGRAVITLLTITAIGFCLRSLFSLLGAKASSLHLTLSLASVPLGWLMLHALFAFHYAHLYYARAQSSHGKNKREDRGGLAFPGTEEPNAWDFLYFSFIIGMTAQVSDVQIEDSGMRRLALIHGIVSFFFNTVLLALAVNMAVNAGSSS